jgi:Fic family protein
LLDLIFIQPYCRIENVVDAGIVYRQTAANYLKELCEIGVLEETKVGREKLFIHPRFLQLLTADSHTVSPY